MLSFLKLFIKPATYYKFLFKIFTFLPKRKIIVFESFGGTKYSDNPKALYEYAKKHYPDYKLIWHVKKGYEDVFINEGVPFFTSPSFEELNMQGRAKIWIINARTPKWKNPGKGTLFLQTWHGTPLKKLGLDIKEVVMPGVTTESYKEQFITDTKKWDYLIAQNDYSKEIFKNAFDFPKNKILLTGYPRNDKLFNYNEEEVNRLKAKLGIHYKKKVVLYAPTWRDEENHGQGNYYLNLQLDLNEFSKKFKDVILLVRAHYLISENLNISSYDNIIDVSDYTDINELYLMSDLLITDYSSVFFDYAILKRPMIFYAYDFEKYKNETRGFYFDYKEVPGPIVYNNDELFAELSSMLNSYVDTNVKFRQKYCYLDDGNASGKVFEKIL